MEFGEVCKSVVFVFKGKDLCFLVVVVCSSEKYFKLLSEIFLKGVN